MLSERNLVVFQAVKKTNLVRVGQRALLENDEPDRAGVHQRRFDHVVGGSARWGIDSSASECCISRSCRAAVNRRV
jgi:hypothetical protein